MTARRVKIDEDLPLEVVEQFRLAGWDASSVLEQGMLGWSDDQLWASLVGENRSLVTADTGFADLRRVAAAPTIGIVLLRVWPESRRGYIELADRFLRAFERGRMPGRVISVTPEVVRVRDVSTPRESEDPEPTQ